MGDMESGKQFGQSTGMLCFTPLDADDFEFDVVAEIDLDRMRTGGGTGEKEQEEEEREERGGEANAGAAREAKEGQVERGWQLEGKGEVPASHHQDDGSELGG